MKTPPKHDSILAVPTNTSSCDPTAFLVCPVSDPAQKLCDLVAHAARGDRRAIGAIGIAFGPVLVRMARRITRDEDEAQDVVRDFFDHLLDGRAARFAPVRGRGLSWLGGLIEALASARKKGGRAPSDRPGRKRKEIDRHGWRKTPPRSPRS